MLEYVTVETTIMFLFLLIFTNLKSLPTYL